MTKNSFVKSIRTDYLSLAIGLLVIGLMTSAPLNLDFNRNKESPTIMLSG